MAAADAGDTQVGDPTSNLAPGASPSPTSNTTLVMSGLGDMATRATFMSAFIIIGFVGNSVLIATIAQSSRLRKSSLNLCVVSVAVVNLVDCIINMPLVLGSTISEKWDYGQFACQFNAFFVKLTSVAMLLGLTLMALDRMLAVLNPTQYKDRMTKPRISGFISFTWLQALVLSLPLITGTIPVQPFAARYLCSVGNSASLIYVAMTSLLGYIIPIFATLTFFCVIARIVIKEKLKERNSNSGQAYNVDEVGERKVWREISTSKYVLALFIIWLVFQGPYMLLNYVDQFKNSQEMTSTGANILEFTYLWELDLSFAWMKFSYAIFLPIITFCWRKEIWQKFKNCILCRKSNLIKDASPHSTPNHRYSSEDGQKEHRRQDSQTNGKVPVLFATENGLHFETYETKYGDEDEASDDEVYDEDPLEQTAVTEVATARKCDVMGSRDLMRELDDDTSDYDSTRDIDPFSTSNPISTRTEYDRQLSKSSLSRRALPALQERQTSISNDGSRVEDTDHTDELPEVKQNAFDSGIDSNPNTKEKGKKKKKNKKNSTKVEELVDQNSINDEDHNRNRTSSDSGRGSVEGSVSHREKQRPSLRDLDIDTGDKGNDFVPGKGIATEGEDRSKVKKKKKKKKKDMVEELNVHNQSNEENQGIKGLPDNISKVAPADYKEMDGAGMARRPPLRLKPLEHKTELVEMVPVIPASKVVAPDVHELIPTKRKREESESSSKSATKSDSDSIKRNKIEAESNNKLKPSTDHARSGSDGSAKRRRKRDSGNGSTEHASMDNGSERMKNKPKLANDTKKSDMNALAPLDGENNNPSKVSKKKKTNEVQADVPKVEIQQQLLKVNKHSPR